MSDWKNMDQWYAVLPPSRPTKVELDRIEKYLVNLDKNKPIAVLGSTPEFRDLLFRMGFKHRYLIDKSYEFYSRMSALVPPSVSKNERVLIGEWINVLSAYSQKFSVILSDLTMGNISYDQRKGFYSAIYNSIIPGGIFIDKVLAFDFVVPSLSELFTKYERLPINLETINSFSSEVLFCSELVTMNNIVDSTAFYSFIREGAYSEKIKYFADAAHMITPEGFIWYYGLSWDRLKHDYSSLYRSQKVFIEEDKNSPYYHRTKQFFNEK